MIAQEKKISINIRNDSKEIPEIFFFYFFPRKFRFFFLQELNMKIAEIYLINQRKKNGNFYLFQTEITFTC